MLGLKVHFFRSYYSCYLRFSASSFAFRSASMCMTTSLGSTASLGRFKLYIGFWRIFYSNFIFWSNISPFNRMSAWYLLYAITSFYLLFVFGLNVHSLWAHSNLFFFGDAKSCMWVPARCCSKRVSNTTTISLIKCYTVIFVGVAVKLNNFEILWSNSTFSGLNKYGLQSTFNVSATTSTLTFFSQESIVGQNYKCQSE